MGRDVPLIYHTMHQPKHDKDDHGSWASEKYIAQHVSQLNAAGRQIAHDTGYDILDMELMTAQVHLPCRPPSVATMVVQGSVHIQFVLLEEQSPTCRFDCICERVEEKQWTLALGVAVAVPVN